MKGDVFGEFNVLKAFGTTNGDIGAIKIGGTIYGSDIADSGQIFTQGDVGTVDIKGSIIGGEAARSGQLSVGGKIGSVTLGGSSSAGSTWLRTKATRAARSSADA